MININGLNLDNILIDEKSYENILVCDTNTKHTKLHSMHRLYVFFSMK